MSSHTTTPDSATAIPSMSVRPVSSVQLHDTSQGASPIPSTIPAAMNFQPSHDTTSPMPYPSILPVRRVVRNQQPVAVNERFRLAIVGEAPGEHEEGHGIPFCGPSGQLLNGVLRDLGINRHEVFVGNICQVRPPRNDIDLFSWDGPEIRDGLAALTSDLTQFNPHCVLLLGSSALRAARGTGYKIADWRGSLFYANEVGPFTLRKCVASIHPAAVLREFSWFPLFKFDIKRAKQESGTAELHLPSRELLTGLDAGTLIHLMNTWPSGKRLALDIEGGLQDWPCVSICGDPNKSITIAWSKFNENDHALVLRAFARLMARLDVPKVLQNSLYDNFVLSYGYQIPIRNVVEDTMLKGWEVYCELPKSLGVQASIWTREPFYKAERKSSDTETYFKYCAKDSAVTLEICNAQDSALSWHGVQHYRANVAMLNPLLYMELRGIRYDQENVNRQLSETKKELAEVGAKLNEIAGSELRGTKGSLSAKRLQTVLYTKLGYPPQYKKEAGRKTDKLTSDVEAILALRKRLPEDAFLTGILRHRHLEGVLETLEIKPDPDGRVRCGYNVVGTETGRLTCYTSPTGAGANLQTITKKLRNNYCADPGYDFFQCDLAGADGWTVAAHCKRLGDATMFDDYVAGLKPAKIIALLYQFGPDINKLDRDSLKNACRAVEDDWLYAGSKVVQHGSNYGMGIPTMIVNLMKQSHKKSGEPIYMSQADARILQDCYFARYPGVRLWHAWATAQLTATGSLTSASGHTRIFFGRRFGDSIHETLKEFLADEPQQNTTWATNLAMLRLWNDPDNRRADGSLIIEPLHQVHDALCGQWPRTCRDWARAKVRSYFQNELTIAGTKLIIPFDGAFGPSWGEQPYKL